MRALLVLALLAAILPRVIAACASCTPCTCTPACSCAPAPAATTGGDTPAPVGHPLKGLILDILADKSSLLVKHEEIPGVMRAMTMLLKVDAPTLAAAQTGQAITATLIKKADGWWLEGVTPITAP
jgi:hypothetical protein